MFNPLIDNLHKLKDDDIELKIQDLTKKYHIAAKCGQGQLCSQISSILNMLNDELKTRYRKRMEDLEKNKDKNLDGLINID
jgi:hypothetical protein